MSFSAVTKLVQTCNECVSCSGQIWKPCMTCRLLRCICDRYNYCSVDSSLNDLREMEGGFLNRIAGMVNAVGRGHRKLCINYKCLSNVNQDTLNACFECNQNNKNEKEVVSFIITCNPHGRCWLSASEEYVEFWYCYAILPCAISATTSYKVALQFTQSFRTRLVSLHKDILLVICRIREEDSG